MKKLTKAQEDYINQNWDKTTVKQLVEDTGCSLPTIKKYVKEKELEKKVEDEPVPATKANTQKQIRKDTRFMQSLGRNKTAIVMTEGGAGMGDDFKKKKHKPKSPHIHKPLGEDK